MDIFKDNLALMILIVGCASLFVIMMRILWLDGKNVKQQQDFLQRIRNRILEDTIYRIDGSVCSIADFQKVDPFFQPEMVSCLLFDRLQSVQAAWSQQCYDQLRTLVGEKLYRMSEKRLHSLEKIGQKNLITDIEFLGSKILGATYDSKTGKEEIEIYFDISCYDYLVSSHSSRIISGSNDQRLRIGYYLVFGRNQKVNQKASWPEHCTNCEHELSSNNTLLCPYCNAMIYPLYYDFRLLEKRVIEEEQLY